MRLKRNSRTIDARLGEALALDLSEAQTRLHQDSLRQIQGAFARWWRQQLRGDEALLQQAERLLLEFLPLYAHQCEDEIARIQAASTAFQQQLSLSTDQRQQHRLILEFANTLGATRGQREADRRAFRRHLAADALLERVERKLARRWRVIDLCLERLGTLSLHQLLTETQHAAERWQRWRVERLCGAYLDCAEPRIAVTALNALAKALIGLPAEQRVDCFDQGCAHYKTSTLCLLAKGSKCIHTEKSHHRVGCGIWHKTGTRLLSRTLLQALCR